MKFLLCVDDTDDLTKSTSTGTVSELISEQVIALGGTLEHGISRHQLLLHEDIEYTSHNSSMCFVAEIDGVELEIIWQKAVKILQSEMAPTSDPGLCLCRLDQLQDVDRLIKFGIRAQKEVLSKQEAYTVAKEIGGVRLEEFGGTGIGVIGALAGVGLRLAGNDGTFRGKNGVGEFDVTLPAAEMCQRLGAERIITLNGEYLQDDQPVFISKFAKLVYLNHQVMAVAKKNSDGTYEICKKNDLYNGDRKADNWNAKCADFEVDNDYEECYDEEQQTCYNCLYRRWTATGFICTF